jgi:glycosyltransferase involved in cell wall biosynthesis
MHVIVVCADPDVSVFGATAAALQVQDLVRVVGRRARVTLIAGRKGTRPPGDLAELTVLTLPSPVGRNTAEREQAARLSASAVPDLIADAESLHGPAAMIYERYSLWSTGGMRAAAGRGIPGVLEVNAPLVEEQAGQGRLLDRVGAQQVARTVFADAAVVVAVSEPVARWVRRQSADPRRVHVVPPAVDVSRFRPRVTPARRPFTVGFAGTLEPEHGVDRLIAAVEQMTDGVRLLIVGDGSQLRRLRRLAQPLGSGAVFTGALPPAALPAALAQMDVAVAPYLPSATAASPQAVLEYLAAGTAVVASAMAPLRMVVRDRETGLLVPPGDVEALAGALTRLRQTPALRQALGAEARRAATERHTREQVLDQVFDLAGLGRRRVVTLPVADHVPR